MGFYWPVHLSTVPFTATSTNELKEEYCKNAENIVPTPFYSPPPDQPDTHAQSMIQSEYPHAMIQNQNPTNSPQRTDSSDLSVMGNSTTVLNLTMPAEQSDPSLPNLDDSDKYCKHCDRYFVSQSGLKHHNKARHAGVRPHRCTKCGKRFSELVLLHRHMLRHAPQNKPHKCEHCPKTFCYRNDLRRHMYLHTGAEPYHCAICAKGFARRDHMQKHELTHQSPKKRPLSMDGDLITNVTIVDHPIP
uniref:C2H2-type domain-containing protein n=1 Tax=Anopheles culicifacies TaxID=139723 RepID=A0A182ML05_9DIPT